MTQRARLRSSSSQSLPRVPRANEPWVFPLRDYEIDEIIKHVIPESAAGGGEQGLYLILQKQLAKSDTVELDDSLFLRLMRTMLRENNSNREQLQVAFGRCINSMLMEVWDAVRRAKPDSEQTLGVWS